jgi:hypothetical protein
MIVTRMSQFRLCFSVGFGKLHRSRQSGPHLKRVCIVPIQGRFLAHHISYPDKGQRGIEVAMVDVLTDEPKTNRSPGMARLIGLKVDSHDSAIA